MLMDGIVFVLVLPVSCLRVVVAMSALCSSARARHSASRELVAVGVPSGFGSDFVVFYQRLCGKEVREVGKLLLQVIAPLARRLCIRLRLPQGD
jgi:hypothetical protein